MSNPAVKRILSILEQLQSSPEGLTAQELQEKLNLSRSTLFADLRSLKEMGYAEQSFERSRYRAGPRLAAWRRSSPAEPLELVRAFHSEAASLRTEATLALLLPAADGWLVLAQVQPERRVRSTLVTGQIYPASECASGLLTGEPLAEDVRQSGFARMHAADVVEFALPICPDGYHPEAALLASAPRFEGAEQRLLAYLPELRQAAARLSYRLGAQVYAPYAGPQTGPLGPARSMDESEIREFLSGPWAARLACLRPDGAPHVVPVWQEWDGNQFYVIAWQGSRWGEYLRQNPQISLTVDEPWPPLRRVSASGLAEWVSGPAGSALLPSLLERLSQRYLGRPGSAGFRAQPASLFRFQPERLRGWRGLEAAG